MKDLLECGVHFGHQTRRWNPKMKKYIFGVRKNIYIIDLQKTLRYFRNTYQIVVDNIAEGKTMIFVGTKKQARAAIREAAESCGMPYVDNRWLGGMLTNFKTIKQSIKRLKELEAMEADGSMSARFNKKEQLTLHREMEKLERSLGGIKNMHGLPDAMFVIDCGHEDIAVAEAKKLGIPVVAVVDTNNNPRQIDYVIPGNDDAIRAVQLYVQGAAAAVLEGRSAAARAVAQDAPAEPETVADA